MAVCNDVVHRLDDVMRARVQRRTDVCELVKRRQVFERRRAPGGVEISQLGRTGQRHEQGMVVAERQALGWITRMIGER